MKAWKKPWVAILAVLVMIAAAVGIGQLRRPQTQLSGGKTDLDTTLDTAYLSKYLSDGADLFSTGEEESILLYNANWDQRYNSIVAVVTLTESGDASLYDTALDWADRWQLGAGDAVLVLETAGAGDYYFLTGDDFYTMMPDDVVSRYLDQYLEADFAAGRYGEGVLNLFSAVNELYYDTFGLGNEGNVSGGSSYPVSYGAPRLGTILVVGIVLLLLIASVADHYRYDTYRRRYGGMGTPPVVFRPILFWHRPGWGWYERRWHRPPPPPPPRGPHGPRPGGPRPGGGNPGGFGGMGGFGRGGGFGGGHGGGRSGGRGGGFGGGHGGGRGGGFGGHGGGRR